MNPVFVVEILVSK